MENKLIYEKVLLGYHDKEPIYLSPPTWDCGWYWGWGYLGNNSYHYHVEGLEKIETYNTKTNSWDYKFCHLKDGFDEHFKNTFIIRESQKWEFAELFKSFYKLKDIAEVYNRGGAHLTSNPCKDIIQNLEEVKKINEVILPAIFEATYKIINQNLENDKLFQELVNLNIEGNTSKVMNFMFKNEIKPEDLRSIKDINSYDYSNITTYYYKKRNEK